jgi:hypothetical protein
MQMSKSTGKIGANALAYQMIFHGEEEENMFILQDVPQGKPGYRRLFG